MRLHLLMLTLISSLSYYFYSSWPSDLSLSFVMKKDRRLLSFVKFIVIGIIGTSLSFEGLHNENSS